MGVGRSEYFAHLLVGWRNPFLTALTALLIVLTSRRLGVQRLYAWIAGLSYGIATFAWPQARSTLSDVQATFFLFLAFYVLLRMREEFKRLHEPRARHLFGLGAALSAAVLTRVALVPAAAVIALVTVISIWRGNRDLARLTAAVGWRRSFYGMVGLFAPAGPDRGHRVRRPQPLALRRCLRVRLRRGLGLPARSSCTPFPWGWRACSCHRVAGFCGWRRASCCCPWGSRARGRTANGCGRCSCRPSPWRSRRSPPAPRAGTGATPTDRATCCRSCPSCGSAWGLALERMRPSSTRGAVAYGLLALGLLVQLPAALVDPMTHQELAVEGRAHPLARYPGREPARTRRGALPEHPVGPGLRRPRGTLAHPAPPRGRAGGRTSIWTRSSAWTRAAPRGRRSGATRASSTLRGSTWRSAWGARCCPGQWWWCSCSESGWCSPSAASTPSEASGARGPSAISEARTHRGRSITVSSPRAFRSMQVAELWDSPTCPRSPWPCCAPLLPHPAPAGARRECPSAGPGGRTARARFRHRSRARRGRRARATRGRGRRLPAPHRRAARRAPGGGIPLRTPKRPRPDGAGVPRGRTPPGVSRDPPARGAFGGRRGDRRGRLPPHRVGRSPASCTDRSIGAAHSPFPSSWPKPRAVAGSRRGPCGSSTPLAGRAVRVRAHRAQVDGDSEPVFEVGYERDDGTLAAVLSCASRRNHRVRLAARRTTRSLGDGRRAGRGRAALAPACFDPLAVERRESTPSTSRAISFGPSADRGRRVAMLVGP